MTINKLTDERIEKIAVWLATESHSLNLEMLMCLRELQERRKVESAGFQITDSPQKMALSSLDNKPLIVSDLMAYAFHHALTDSPLGTEDAEDIKTGLRAAFAYVAVAEPVQIVTDERTAFNTWNNDKDLPIAGVSAEKAGWLAWQARAKLPPGNAPKNLEGLVITAAAADVLAERKRQVTEKGWTAERDDAYEDSELADAASCYALHAHNQGGGIPTNWPWSRERWKQKSPRRDLVKAGSLILAEIERLDRA